MSYQDQFSGVGTPGSASAALTVRPEAAAALRPAQRIVEGVRAGEAIGITAPWLAVG